MKEIRYIIISPVRNEAKNVIKTIDSVLSQTIRPLKWIIVDDGSSDETALIVDEYVKKNPWIYLIRLADRGFYDLTGGGEIRAFYRGYKIITDRDYEYLVKLDGDISFNETYFADLFGQFELNGKLGIASGTCYYYDGDRLRLERCFWKHVRGAARAYRKKCWDEIGGTVDKLGWDAMDVYKARMLGWETRSFEEIVMIHHVKTWTKGGLVHGRVRSGRIEYLIGTHPLFFFAKVGRELFRKPFIIGSAAMSIGYLGPWVKKERRVVAPVLMTFIRRDQLSRLRLRLSKRRDRENMRESSAHVKTQR